jgi:hypothetical protein
MWGLLFFLKQIITFKCFQFLSSLGPGYEQYLACPRLQLGPTQSLGALCSSRSADPEADQRWTDHPQACDSAFSGSMQEKHLGSPKGQAYGHR